MIRKLFLFGITWILFLIPAVIETNALAAQEYILAAGSIGGDRKDEVVKAVEDNGLLFLYIRSGQGSQQIINTTDGSLPLGGDDPYLAIYDGCTMTLQEARLYSSSSLDVPIEMVVEGGNLYTTGYSGGTDFPVTNGSTNSGNRDVYFQKLDLSGNVIYSTYLGGDEDDSPAELLVESGIVHLLINSQSSNFPVTNGSTKSGTPTDSDVIYCQLDEATGNIIFATYIGGNGMNNLLVTENLIVDGNDVYFGINTTSSDLPVTNGSTFGGGFDFAIIKLDKATGNISAMSYFGGSSQDRLHQVKFVGGELHIMSSSSQGMTTTNGSFLEGFIDVHYAKLDANLSILAATYFGGSGIDPNSGIVTFEVYNNEVYFAFKTSSSNIPATDGYYPTTTNNVVFAKLDASANTVFSYYIDGGNTEVTELNVVNDKVYLTGVIAFPFSFITTNGTSSNGAKDRWLRIYTTSGDMEFSSLYGGNNVDGVTTITANQGMLIDGSKIYLIGHTFSSDYPVTNGSSLTGLPFVGAWDASVTVVETCPTGFNDPTTVTPAVQNVCIFGFVEEIDAEHTLIDGSTLPMLYLDGVPKVQPDLYANYQWQESPTATGAWTDIPGAVGKNYSPPPLGVTTYYRRISSTSACCGSAIISTTDAACINVNTNIAPVADAGGIYNTCPGTAVTIGVSVTNGTPPYTYEWIEGSGTTPVSTASSFSVTPPTSSGAIYTVIVTDNLGCQHIDQAVINAYEADAGPDAFFCEDSPGVLIGGPPIPGLSGVMYSWSPPTGLDCTTCAQPTATPAAPTTYTLTLTIPITSGGTCMTTDDVLVTPINKPSVLDFAGPDVVICWGSTGTIGIAPDAGFSYTWAPGNYLAANTFTPATFDSGNDFPDPNPITYYLTAEKEGCVWYDSMIVSVIKAKAIPYDVCGPRLAGLPDETPNINDVFTWTKISGDGNFLSATNIPQATLSASTVSTTYELNVTYNGTTCTDQTIVPPCGCSIEVDDVSEYNCPSYGLNSGDVTLVAIGGGTVPGPFTFTWSPAAGLSSTTGSSVMLTDNINRTYTVTLTSDLDPTFTCSTTIEVNNPAWSLPVFNTTDGSICPGDPVSIGDTPIAGYAYEWTDGVTLSDDMIANPIATPTATTKYYVKIVDIASTCTAIDSAIVTVNNSPTDAGNDHLVCDNGTISIGSPADPNTTYSWTPAGSNWQNGTNATSAQPDVLVAVSTTFILTTTNTLEGCTQMDTVEVVVGNPEPAFTMPNISYCPSDGVVTLGSGGPTGAGLTYSWSPEGLLTNSTTLAAQTLNPPPNTATTFTLTVKNASGCEQISTQLITPTQIAPDAGSSKTICKGESIVIGGTNPSDPKIIYAWTPATDLDNPASPNPEFTGNTAGTFTYTLTATSAATSCSSTSSIEIIVNEFTVGAIPSQTICEGACVNIGVDPISGATFNWSPTTGLDDPTSSNPLACVSVNTIYTLTAVGPNGCIEEIDVPVYTNPVPAPIVTLDTLTICSGQTGQLLEPVVTPAGTYNYSWTPADGTLIYPYSATPEVLVPGPGTYHYDLTVTNPATGCATTVNAVVIVEFCPTLSPPPPVPASLGNYVWVDEDGNGLQDEGEPGIPNVAVILKDGSGTPLDTLTTDAEGGYLFTDLPAGSYTVEVDPATLPNGLTQTTNPTNASGDFGNQSGPYAITLEEGDENVTGDFGFSWGDPDGNAGDGAIGDYVWIDTNGDGLQEDNEVALGGVPVEIYYDSNGDGIVDCTVDMLYTAAVDQNGTTGTGTTTTNDDGSYIFHSLPAGQYQIKVTPPAGYTQTGDPDGTNDNMGEPVLLAPGDVLLTQDFGFQPAVSGSIGDQVWFDTDADGALNNDDFGIPGVTVALFKDLNGDGWSSFGEPVIGTTTTDAAGMYLFDGLPLDDGSGTCKYVVVVTDTDNILEALAQTFDDNGVATADESGTTLSAGTPNDLDQDFGYSNNKPGSGLIGDKIFLDADASGSYDSGEGIEGVTVYLLNNSGTAIAETITDEHGCYFFGELPPEDYTVDVDETTLPPGLTNSFDPDGGTLGESDVTLPVGAIDLDQDFGYVPSGTAGSIGTIIWEDHNADGVNDGPDGPDGIAGNDDDEPGIENMWVQLYHDINGNGLIDADDPVIAHQTTDATGNYLFSNLPVDDGAGNPVNYVVDVLDCDNIIEGWWHSNGAVDMDDNSQADVYPVELSAGAPDVVTADFGYFHEPASLGNYVWEDSNADGIQDAGEPAIEGVEVKLKITYPDGTVVTIADSTDANGHYAFHNLMLDEDYNGAGTYGTEPTYNICVTTPTGYMTTIIDVNTNGNDLEDSDDPAGVTGVPTQGLIGTDAEVDPNDEITHISYDFGFIKEAKLGNYVWEDTDYNGLQNPIETGINGVTVILVGAGPDGVWGNADDVNTSTVTANDPDTGDPGWYNFCGLRAGDFVMTFTNPTGFTPTIPDEDPTDVKDSDLHPLTSMTDTIALSSGETNNDIDAGFNQVGAIGSFVWKDLNEDGEQDAGEAGIDSVIVYLYTSTGVLEDSTMTDGMGAYFFANVVPGEYYLEFDFPTGCIPTITDASGGADSADSSTDSDMDGTTGQTGNYTVSAGEVVDYVDAGFKEDVMPLDLLSFDARLVNCNVVLNWITGSEFDTDYFDVEYSTNGEEFKSVGRIEASGNSETIRSYSFDSREALVGNHYYRLKMVDLDGSFTYSDISTVKFDCYKNELTIQPNVSTSGNITVQFIGTSKENGTLSVVDALGRIIEQLPIDIEKGTNNFPLNIDRLAVGVYFINVDSDNWDKAKVAKYIKQE